MNSFMVLALICLIVATAKASPVPQSQPENDLFAGFLRNAQLAAPSQHGSIVKRRIFEDNSDRELKQISFASLIGDLESSLFASALSVNKVINDNAGEVQEIKPLKDEEHSINKRHSGELTNETPVSTAAQEHRVILQTTEKVPESEGVPAHYIIDRIAIHPHTGSVPLIPTFEIQRTRPNNQSNDHEITKITISKTEITSLPNTTAAPVVAATTEVAVQSSTATVESSTATVETSTATTPKNIEQLKEAEEELKEKVAEIEADPVILSARV